MTKTTIILLLLGIATAVTLGILYFHHKAAGEAKVTQNIDPNSYSNIDEIRMNRWTLNFAIDFNNTLITGENKIIFTALIDGVKQINLDSKALTFKSVKEVKSSGDIDLDFEVRTNKKLAFLGEQLVISLKDPLKAGELVTIKIEYQTSKSAEALSWLTPEQTASKKSPYLYSQCEPISCRSILPFQDTPSNKVQWIATAEVPKDINVFLSANLTNTRTSGDKKFVTFTNTMPMATYVFAIVAGNVELKKVGRRTGVITEPTFIEAYTKELSDLEKYLETVENYIGPYRWGIYNIVILPPSFPLGGMENPLLTFASPTIIVGDKSGVFVAIHEIAHSWTGNLVTCVNWDHLWLNEGFAVFLERKASRTLFGQQFYDGEVFDGNVSLNNAISTFGAKSEYTKLYPNMKGLNPNSGSNECPYEKGFQFLSYIESLIGEDSMRDMLRGYVAKYALKSIDVYAFNNYVINYVRLNFPVKQKEILSKIDFAEWENTPGYTPIPLSVHSQDIDSAFALADAFITNQGKTTPQDSDAFPKFVKVIQYIFLETMTKLSSKASLEVISQLDSLYNLSNSTDGEILQRWFTFTTLMNYQPNLPKVEKFLASVGRMKMIVPLYTNIAKHDKSLAKQIFSKNKSFYHPLAVEAIEPVLN